MLEGALAPPVSGCAEWRRQPRAESSVTQHHLSAGGRSFDYTATAGTLVIRDNDDKPMADIGYIAYTRRDPKDAGQRPVMFAFNGGPGSSSLWLHMGVLGPKRVLVSDPGPTPPAPYKTVDNEFGVLDKTDLTSAPPSTVNREPSTKDTPCRSATGSSAEPIVPDGSRSQRNQPPAGPGTPSSPARASRCSR